MAAQTCAVGAEALRRAIEAPVGLFGIAIVDGDAGGPGQIRDLPRAGPIRRSARSRIADHV